MSHTKEFFMDVTQRIFSNWTALKMAVEHGMGPKSSAIDFCPYITEIMYTNENLSGDDIAAELEEYMDDKFSTELQDNSAIEVAQLLLKFHKYCIEGNEVIAATEMDKLPPLQSWILSREAIRRQINNTNDTVASANDNNTATEDEKETAGNAMEVANDDDWVQVKTRRKKSK